MKSKILLALKTKYANKGFGDKAFDGVAEFLSKTVTDEAGIETAIAGVEVLLTGFQSEADKVRTEKSALQKQLDDYKAAHPEAGGDPNKNEPTDDFDKKIAAAVAAAMKPVTDELAGYKAKETQSVRQKTIVDKCKALGIPEWRQQEGFSIADDADETTIDTYLAGVKKNITTNALPTNESGLTLSPSEKQLSDLAVKSVDNLPDIK